MIFAHSAASATSRRPAGSSWVEGGEEEQDSAEPEASGKEDQSSGSGSSFDESEVTAATSPCQTRPTCESVVLRQPVRHENQGC